MRQHRPNRHVGALEIAAQQVTPLLGGYFLEPALDHGPFAAVKGVVDQDVDFAPAADAASIASRIDWSELMSS